MKEQRRKWRNRLVQRGFQIRYTFLIVAVPAAVFLVLGTLYYQEIEAQDAMLMNLETTQALMLEQDEVEEGTAIDTGLHLEAIDRHLPEEIRYLEEMELYLHGEENWRTGLLVGSFVGMVLVLSLLGVLLTHRIAGPMIAVDRILVEIARDRWTGVRRFRKRDEFKFLDKRIQALLSSLRIREQQELEALQKVRDALGDGEEDADSVARLDALIQAKRERITDVAPDDGPAGES